MNIKDMKHIIYGLIRYHKGDWEKIYYSISSCEKIDCNKCNDRNFISIVCDEYPEPFKEIYKPPFGIFAYGDRNLLKGKRFVPIFGNAKNVSNLRKFKDKDFVLIVDSENKKVINYLLKNKMKFIVVVGNGLVKFFSVNKIYDQIISSGNLIISELPIGFDFLVKTKEEAKLTEFSLGRLIAGFSKSILCYKEGTPSILNLRIKFLKNDLKDILNSNIYESADDVINSWRS